MDLSFPTQSAPSPNAKQLKQLSDEVNRIAGVLAKLATSSASDANGAWGDRSKLPPVQVETVQRVIALRRLRDKYFDRALLADPGWDMLLDLFHAELANLRVPVSSLCVAASVPATTALRWIKMMANAGLFYRKPDPLDGRRIYVELSPEASEAMHRYFVATRSVQLGPA